LISAEAPPQTPLRELTALPQIPGLDFRGPTSKAGEKRGRGEDRGKERKGKRVKEKGEEEHLGKGKRGKGRRSPQLKFLATPLPPQSATLSLYPITRKVLLIFHSLEGRRLS